MMASTSLRELGVPAVLDGSAMSAVGARVCTEARCDCALPRTKQQAGVLGVDRSNWKDATNCLVGSAVTH